MPLSSCHRRLRALEAAGTIRRRVALIDPDAVGLGLILTLYCDMRFASSDAKFGTAFARRGLIAEYGMAWMLPRLIGHANALDLLLSARIIHAEEAAQMGLVNRVIPAETFAEDVRQYALELVNNVSPRSMRVIKKQVYDAMFQTLEEARDALDRVKLVVLVGVEAKLQRESHRSDRLQRAPIGEAKLGLVAKSRIEADDHVLG